MVEGNVESEGGRVMMRPQRRLFIRPVADHKVHHRPGLRDMRKEAGGVALRQEAF